MSTSEAGPGLADSIRLRRLSVQRASDLLADELRSTILEGGLRGSTRLPSQQELMRQTGLGRSTVREALKMLEAEGLVTLQTGRSGGPRVRTLEVDDVVQTMRVFVQGQRIDLRMLLETRQAVEPFGAASAARRATPEELDELDHLHAGLVESRADPEAFLDANVRWHLAVVRASHNPLLVAFETAIAEIVHAGMTATETRLEAQTVEDTIAAHAKVLEKIRLRDEDGAARAMTRHLHVYREQETSVQDIADADLSIEFRAPS